MSRMSLLGKVSLLFSVDDSQSLIENSRAPISPEDIEQFDARLLQSMEGSAGDNAFLRQAKGMMAQRLQVMWSSTTTNVSLNSSPAR
jgi:hypothetical protein